MFCHCKEESKVYRGQDSNPLFQISGKGLHQDYDFRAWRELVALICPVLLGPFSNWEWLGRKPLDEIRSNRFGAAPWEPTIDSCAVILASKKGKKRKRKQETESCSSVSRNQLEVFTAGPLPSPGTPRGAEWRAGPHLIRGREKSRVSLLHMLCILPAPLHP